MVESMITVFVGDVNEYLANIALQHSSDAKLITAKNYKNIRAGTYYTSIGDLITQKKFSSVLKQSDIIIYSPPDVWSRLDSKRLTEYWITVMRAFEDKTVVNADHLKLPLLNKFLHLVDSRKTESSQLWISGCSITHGVGVKKAERYGQLLSDQLNAPVSFLTAPGSSIPWSADQLLRSDLRAGDIVVWGLTAMGRMSWFQDNGDLKHVNIYTYLGDPEFDNHVKITRIWEQDRAYDAITKIHQVINFCAKIGVKLYLAGILVDLHRYSLDFENFIPFYRVIKENKDRQFKTEYQDNQFLDIGTDPERHPGPRTHQWYADKILEKISNDSVTQL
jgi:hypothetical protein